MLQKKAQRIHKNNKVILKTQQRFESKRHRHNAFTEEINKMMINSNDDKNIQSIESIETDAYGTSKDLVSEKEEIKCKQNMIKLNHKRA